ncbi:hypothetical protein AVEN_222803-1 [Araneus ventricosus]|uniref:Uncharacterized protein n=1 Tax=Araneus ventricosus TaxID=182803 RepID=A0A4Y2H095_ARAVE|nr:hypothetical protein AVEN_222803-1 [Araneus ventricosus]
MQHEFSRNMGGHLSQRHTPSLKALGNGLRFARITGPPITLISKAISEPPLPSEEPNRLKPAFVAVKRKRERLVRYERVQSFPSDRK